jgi:hypothetical protein
MPDKLICLVSLTKLAAMRIFDVKNALSTISTSLSAVKSGKLTGKCRLLLQGSDGLNIVPSIGIPSLLRLIT